MFPSGCFVSRVHHIRQAGHCYSLYNAQSQAEGGPAASAGSTKERATIGPSSTRTHMSRWIRILFIPQTSLISQVTIPHYPPAPWNVRPQAPSGLHCELEGGRVEAIEMSALQCSGDRGQQDICGEELSRAVGLAPRWMNKSALTKKIQSRLPSEPTTGRASSRPDPGQQQ